MYNPEFDACAELYDKWERNGSRLSCSCGSGYGHIGWFPFSW